MKKLNQTFLASALLLAASPAALASVDHYIYDADVVLFDDYDEDGFFTFLSVRIDADTIRSSAWVYAELYLSPDGVTWEHYHSTDDFWIGGATGDDELFVETELVSGYPTGYYDLLIELYDADFGTFSDEFGPYPSEGMELLPLEDVTQDPEPVEVVIVEDHGGGGAFGWAFIPALLLAGRRIRKQRVWRSF
jgi:hypothetical protein